MNAEAIMTHDPAVVLPDDTIVHAAMVMATRGIGLVPVVDDPTHRKLVGVLTDRDIVTRCIAANHGAECLARHHMTSTDLATVSPVTDVEDIVEQMELNQVRRIPVVEDSGRLVGIVAQADIAQRLGSDSPELVARMLEHVSATTPLVC